MTEAETEAIEVDEKIKGRSRATTESSLLTPGSESYSTKLILWALPRIIVIVFFIVLFVWIYQAEGGIGWTEDSVFGVHALCMSLFAVFFTTEAVLVFRSPLVPHRLMQNMYIHLICHVGGLVCAIVGIVAIVNYKNWSSQPVSYPNYTLYTPHSLLGVVTLLLWFVHLSGGFLVFVLSRWPIERYGDQVIQVHHFLGKCVYVLLLVCCAMGLQDMQSSDLASEMAGEAAYGPFSTLARLACAGVWLLAALGIAVFANFQFIKK